MNVSDWKPVINKGFCITITKGRPSSPTTHLSTPLNITMSGGRQKYNPTEWQVSFSEDEVSEKLGGTETTHHNGGSSSTKRESARNSKSCNRVRPAQYSFRQQALYLPTCISIYWARFVIYLFNTFRNVLFNNFCVTFSTILFTRVSVFIPYSVTRKSAWSSPGLLDALFRVTEYRMKTVNIRNFQSSFFVGWTRFSLVFPFSFRIP
jgi:hypothetical protein